ncbi:MAG: hypothetical protein NC397_04375 [Clostridium sp.]|nr:hypothetical protein [Clostridium sp.]
MKKFFAILGVILLAVVGIYGYDILSGYKITVAVNEHILSNPVTSAQSTAKPDTGTANLNKLIYSKLSQEEQTIYNTIYNGISCFKSPIILKNAPDSDMVFKLVKLVLGDHPEIFWTRNGCTYTTDGILNMNYIYSRAEALEKQSLINNQINAVLDNINQNSSEYDISLALFDWVALNTAYDYDNLDNLEKTPSDSTIEGVFLNKKAVCSGYAKAYQLLLQKCNIEALYITGEATAPNGTEKHAWVCQMLDGYYYFSDPTWADSYEKTLDDNFVSHTFFNVTSNELALTHTPEEEYLGITSSAAENNYFIKEGLCFDAFSLTELRPVINASVKNNEIGIELKYNNSEAYNQAVSSLIDDGEIYLVLKTVDPFSHNVNSNQISYYCDDMHNVIMLIYNK